MNSSGASSVTSMGSPNTRNAIPGNVHGVAHGTNNQRNRQRMLIMDSTGLQANTNLNIGNMSGHGMIHGSSHSGKRYFFYPRLSFLQKMIPSR